jgi:hypothetical protein
MDRELEAELADLRIADLQRQARHGAVARDLRRARRARRARRLRWLLWPAARARLARTYHAAADTLRLIFDQSWPQPGPPGQVG